MVKGGLKREEPVEALVVAAGKTHTYGVIGWGGIGGGCVGNDGFPPKRKGAVLGGRAS